MLSFFTSKISLVYLFLVVFISYSQIIFMGVWQDDNALFFKLAHIEERAGYLGYGIFGEGAYKYTATFYYPIYLLFGFNTVYYFLLCWLFYLSSVFTIYFVFKKILGDRPAFWASLFYSSGYLASDGFIRLFNSIITSLSVILICWFVYFYWSFFNAKKLQNYLFSVLFFFLTIEFARARTHYLLVIPFLFEILHLRLVSIRKIYLSVTRIVPFFLVFYYYFILNADARSGNIGDLLKQLLEGKFALILNYLNSISNLIYPFWVVDLFVNINLKSLLISKYNLPITQTLLLLLLIMCFYAFFKRVKFYKIFLLIFFVLVGSSFYLLQESIKVSDLSLASHTAISSFLGLSITIFLFLFIFKAKKQLKVFYIIFVIWLFTNIGAYWAYSPQVIFEPVNRYIAHSFFCLAILIGVFAKSFEKSKFQIVFYLIVVTLIVGNLFYSISYQKNIIDVRTKPTLSFYNQLKKELPTIKKGDVLYFDIHPNSQNHFSNSFSVAQMPETTAIAWRYGLDRYDFEMFTDYESLFLYLSENPSKISQVQSFWYKDGKLIKTSKKLREELSQYSLMSQNLTFQDLIINTILNPEFTIPLEKKPSAIVSQIVKLNIWAIPKFPSNINLSPIDRNTREKLINVLKYKKTDNMKVSASSEWQERITNNLNDHDKSTIWQSDRVLWDKEKTFISLDLQKNTDVGRIIWVNGYSNNTPTHFVVETSDDGVSYTRKKEIVYSKSITDQNPQEINLVKNNTRFIRLNILDTISDDAPAIAEIYVLPSEFNDLSLSEIQDFELQPFLNTNNETDFYSTLESLNYQGKVQLSWQSDKSDGFLNSDKSFFEILYDGQSHDYEIKIPAGGTHLSFLRLGNIQIPGILKINSISFQGIMIDE